MYALHAVDYAILIAYFALTMVAGSAFYQRRTARQLPTK